MDSIDSAVTFDDLSVPSSQSSDKMRKDGEKTIEYKKFEWITMKKRVIELVQMVNVSNVQIVADQIMSEDLILGRGPFCQAIIKSQLKFPELSHVYASLVAIINSKFPDVGLLLVKRAVLQFREAYDRKDKKRLQTTSRILAHLVNKTVVYEILALDVLMFLLVSPSSDSVEVAVSFCTRCGSLLMDTVPCKFKEILEEFRRVLRNGALEKRVQVSIVRLFAAKKSRFKAYRNNVDELDVVEVDDQVTHDVSLLQDIDAETGCDSFRANYLESDEAGDIMIPCDQEFEDDFEVSSRPPTI